MKKHSRAKAASLKSEAFAKAKKVAPRQAIHIGSTPATRFRGDAAIFGRLVEDHDRHRALFSMIEASEGSSPDRTKLFRELVHEIKGHAAAEEQALWSTVLRHPESTDAGRHAVAEHKKIDAEANCRWHEPEGRPGITSKLVAEPRAVLWRCFWM